MKCNFRVFHLRNHIQNELMELNDTHQKAPTQWHFVGELKSAEVIKFYKDGTIQWQRVDDE